MLLEDFNAKLKECPVVAIMRGVSVEDVIPSCEALASAGVRLMEITMNSPDAINCIKMATGHFDGSEIMIGAGTVLKPDEVDAIAVAGGKYIISPNVNPAVIRRTKEHGLVSIPGFMTPTEGFLALETGADFLKCFPAGTLGVDYIKSIKAVIPAPILATGSIDKDNAANFLTVSAGLGVGSFLYKPGRSPEELQACSRSFLKVI
jgi:2-dehydro-3-deoxyphosphogalactonate aldolase